MSRQRHEFILPPDGAAPVIDPTDAAPLALCQADPVDTVRTWLDSFDARLWRAGLVLEHDRATAQLQLRERGTDRILAVAPGIEWPGDQAPPLPPGLLRERVQGALGPRALTVMARQALQVQLLQLLDAHDKVRVRCRLEIPRQAGAAAGPRLHVETLRGFKAEARALRARLRGRGLARAREERLAALAAASDGPGLAYSARPQYQLQAGAPTAGALARILDAGFTVMQQNLPGILDDTDSEFLHDFRTAARRTRTVLGDTHEAIAAAPRQHWRRAFRELSHRTSALRDLDVLLLDLPALREQVEDHHAGAFATFAAGLQVQREAARDELQAWLAGPAFADMQRDWKQFIADLHSGEAGGAAASRPVAIVAEASIARLYRRLAKQAARVDVDTPFPDLHEIRKLGKRLRYMIEAFSQLGDDQALALVLKELKKVQDRLGRLCDLDVQQRSFAGYTAVARADGDIAQAAMLEALQNRFHQAGRASRKRLVRRLHGLAGRPVAQAIAQLVPAPERP